jgi:sugar phosphate isomerase/epimerase
MIRHPLALRLDPNGPVREQIHEAARLGARGVILDAIGDVAPRRLSETGRRELRHLLKTVELALVGLALPTRRPFNTTDQLDDRIRRADAAFAMAYELGASLVLVRAGTIPSADDTAPHDAFTHAVRELGLRADYRGVRLGLETGSEPATEMKTFFDRLGLPSLAASVDPASCLQAGIDPVDCVRELAEWVVHAYAGDATRLGQAAAPNPRGIGFPPGALDWEEYLGALEEIAYQGYLTIWPASGRSAAAEFEAVSKRLKRLS